MSQTNRILNFIAIPFVAVLLDSILLGEEHYLLAITVFITVIAILLYNLIFSPPY